MKSDRVYEYKSDRVYEYTRLKKSNVKPIPNFDGNGVIVGHSDVIYYLSYKHIAVQDTLVDYRSVFG